MSRDESQGIGMYVVKIAMMQLMHPCLGSGKVKCTLQGNERLLAALPARLLYLSLGHANTLSMGMRTLNLPKAYHVKTTSKQGKNHAGRTTAPTEIGHAQRKQPKHLQPAPPIYAKRPAHTHTIPKEHFFFEYGISLFLRMGNIFFHKHVRSND